MTAKSAFPLLVIVPVKSAHEAEPLFLQEVGSCRLIDLTLSDAESPGDTDDVMLCVTTDDERIASHIETRRAGWSVKARGEDELRENYFATLRVALSWAQKNSGKDFGAVLILEPSHPFRPKGLIANALEMFDRDPALDTVVSVVREYGNLWTEDGRGNLHRMMTPMGRNFFREVAGLCLLTKPKTIAEDNAIGHDVGFVVIEEQWALIDIHGAEGVDMARKFYDILIIS